MTQPPQIIADLMSHLKSIAILRFPGPVPQCAPTGSRVICTPPVLDTDNDWLVFVPLDLSESAMVFLESAGATHSAEQETYPDGVCYRYGEINPILIWDYSKFYQWVAATHWAARLNLRDKADRTTLFKALVDCTTPIEQLIL